MAWWSETIAFGSRDSELGVTWTIFACLISSSDKHIISNRINYTAFMRRFATFAVVKTVCSSFILIKNRSRFREWTLDPRNFDSKGKDEQQFGSDVSTVTHTAARVLPTTLCFDFMLQIPHFQTQKRSVSSVSKSWIMQTKKSAIKGWVQFPFSYDVARELKIDSWNVVCLTTKSVSLIFKESIKCPMHPIKYEFLMHRHETAREKGWSMPRYLQKSMRPSSSRRDPDSKLAA